MLKSTFEIIVLFLSISVHEFSHGLMAFKLGDETPKLSGRLTLNPLKHIDPFGTIFLPLFLWIFTQGRGPIFGWAKPVPVNPFSLKDPRFGMIKIALAGPFSNLFIGAFFAFLCRFLPPTSPLFQLFSLISFSNFFLGFFNLLPTYPLDGFHLVFNFLSEKWIFLKSFLFTYGFLILILALPLTLELIASLSRLLFIFFSGL